MQLVLSESARVTTAEESRFRIADPNSRPRVSCIIALDGESLAALKALKDHPWNGARFFRYVEVRPTSLPNVHIDAVIEDIEGDRKSLSEEITRADMVVMVTTAGSAPHAAEIIGNACFVRGKRATGLVLVAGESGKGLTKTLTAMRPYAAMLVVSTGEDYIAEMLSALRA